VAPWIASWHGAILLAALGMAADLDLLVGAHRAYSHSLGASFLILLAAMAVAPSSEPRLLTGVACGAAYASHLLLDWLGADTSVPIGIMALWPFSSDYYQSPVDWFLSTERRYWLPQFWTVNFAAVTREVGTLLPIAAAVYWIRRRKV
jgi:inner membrane protein